GPTTRWPPTLGPTPSSATTEDGGDRRGLLPPPPGRGRPPPPSEGQGGFRGSTLPGRPPRLGGEQAARGHRLVARFLYTGCHGRPSPAAGCRTRHATTFLPLTT